MPMVAHLLNGELRTPERLIEDAFRAALYAALAYSARAMPITIDVTHADGHHHLDSLPVGEQMAPVPSMVREPGDSDELTDLELHIKQGFDEVDKPTKISVMAARLKHSLSSNFRAAVARLVGLGKLIRNEHNEYWPAGKPLPE
jgi:hypothetical protein